jgi:signal transduction histidine kinase
MNLKEWFLSKITFPSLILNLTICFIITSISLLQFYQEIEMKKAALNDIVDLANLGLTQKNRVLVESVLNLSISSLNVDKVILCEGERLLFSYPNLLESCNLSNKHFWNITINKNPKGRSDILFIFTLKWFNYLQLLLILSIILSSIYLVFHFTISKLKNHFENEILNPISNLNEFSSNISEISDLIIKNKELGCLKVNAAIHETMINLASQVAHDIRSPLTGLNMAIGSLSSEISEDKRVLLRAVSNRINDIANQLLIKSKSIQASKSETLLQVEEVQQLNIELLPTILDLLITEKRIQFQNKPSISISSDFDNGYGAFVKINSNEFKRVISNLINNSLDAFKDNHGEVIISIHSTEKQVTVIVSDNGIGIPKSIIEKLGIKGFSFGKTENNDSGTGLGVYHAKTTIESFGGNLKVSSTEGIGTDIIIELPSCNPPSWFVDCIDLNHTSQIVILDDDVNILNIWKQKFTNNNITKFPKLIYFNNIEAFRKWFDLKQFNINSSLFLVDYEFTNSKLTGLDIISELQIAKNSFLVTSRFEELQIRNKCENIKLKLIPKSMAFHIPLKLEEGNKYD